MPHLRSLRTEVLAITSLISRPSPYVTPHFDATPITPHCSIPLGPRATPATTTSPLIPRFTHLDQSFVARCATPTPASARRTMENCFLKNGTCDTTHRSTRHQSRPRCPDKARIAASGCPSQSDIGNNAILNPSAARLDSRNAAGIVVVWCAVLLAGNNTAVSTSAIFIRIAIHSHYQSLSIGPRHF